MPLLRTCPVAPTRKTGGTDGSYCNTSGSAAEKLDRRWLAFEKDRTCLAASTFRFVDKLPAEELATLWSQLHSDVLSVAANRLPERLASAAPPY